MRANEPALAGVLTHLAVADEPGDPYTTEQLAVRFDAVLDALTAAGLRPALADAANSAGLLTCADARYDLVRGPASPWTGSRRRPDSRTRCLSLRRPRCRCAPGSRW